MATKKTTARKTSAPKTAKESPTRKTGVPSAPAVGAMGRKSAPRKRVSTPASNTASAAKPEGALHSVARSIGSTLGSIAKKTSKAVEAAKQVMPGSRSSGETTEPE